MSKTNRPKIIFVLSFLTAAFWVVGQFVDVYHFAIVGAIFEIVWLPMIVLLFVLPVLSLFYLVKEKFSPKSLYLYSFLMLLATGLFLYLKS
ncbi:hypothetical protein ACV07N_15425 [Roseivirga echinicomitans]